MVNDRGAKLHFISAGAKDTIGRLFKLVGSAHDLADDKIDEAQALARRLRAAVEAAYAELGIADELAVSSEPVGATPLESAIDAQEVADVKQRGKK